MMYRRLGLTTGLAALVAVAACGGKAAPAQADGELRRDLELAKSEQGIELLPAGSRMAVVSAIEQTGTAEPAPSPRRTRESTARPAPRRTTPQPRPQARVTRAPTPTPERQAERPRPVFGPDVISPPPPGGYKTVDEVIRNAPFPIKP